MTQLPILQEIRACTHCEAALPMGVNPILEAVAETRIALIGQAPRRIVHLPL